MIFSRFTGSTYTIYIGQVTNIFASASTITTWKISTTPSLNLIGMIAKFVGLNNFYYAGYSMGTSKYFSQIVANNTY